MRLSGRTTKQILEAPKNAVFVWCAEQLDYPKRLAQTCKREDLTIVGPAWITDERWRGARLSGLVVDHFTRFNMAEWESYLQALTQVRP